MALFVPARRFPDAVSRRRPRSPLPLAVGLVLALAAALLAAGLVLGGTADRVRPPVPLAQTIARASAPRAFDLVGWQTGALAEGVLRRARAAFALPALDEAQQRDLVVLHFAVAGETSRLRRQLDAARARPVGERDEPATADLKRRLAESEARLGRLSEATTEIIARQVGAYLVADGLAGAPLEPVWRLAFPPLTFDVSPPVFFRFERLPLLLVVAPRDKIAVLHNGFLKPDLATDEMEAIEAQIERLDVASLVLPIGGFAAYPSMIPHSNSLRHGLRVVAHEWLHHYLALRPLGQSYFAGYALRGINETVADLAGKEIADGVFQRYYAGYVTSPDEGLLRPDATPSPPAFDFSAAMAEIRRDVVAFLALGDVAGAEQHMAERRQWLETHGYYLRKLNTAYLAFYGAYAGTGNPYEPKLRRFRAERNSLADFLQRVATISSERDFDVLVGD